MKTPVTIPNVSLMQHICALLYNGKRVCLRAKGDSMYPFIYGGEDILLITPVKEKLKRGDIVLAHDAKTGYVAHRIIRLKAEEAILMGDGNLRQREYVKLSQIKGRVEAVVRNNSKHSLLTRQSRTAAFFWVCLLPLRKYLLFLLREYKKPDLKQK